jgi:hypothetical protein
MAIGCCVFAGGIQRTRSMKRGFAVCGALVAWLSCGLPGTASSSLNPDGPSLVMGSAAVGSDESAVAEPAQTDPGEAAPTLDPSDVLEGGNERRSDVVVVPDAGGTIHLFSLGLAALAGIGWVRCRADSVPR